MSIILALMTVLLMILLGSIRSKKTNSTVLVKRYVHPGHTWARINRDGDVVVGVDDLAQSLIGTIDEIRLPHLLKKVRQGDGAVQIGHGRRRVSIVSPVTGRVIEKNEAVLLNPGLINDSPYGEGWLFKVRSRNLTSQVHNLFSGKLGRLWQDVAKTNLVHAMSSTPALMYQDGGIIVKDFADRCSDAEWDLISREVFLADESSVVI